MLSTNELPASLSNSHWKFYYNRLLKGSAKIVWHKEGEKVWFKVPSKGGHLYIELPLPIPSGGKKWKGKYVYLPPGKRLTAAEQYDKIAFTLSTKGWQGVPQGFACVKVWTIKKL